MELVHRTSRTMTDILESGRSALFEEAHPPLSIEAWQTKYPVRLPEEDQADLIVGSCTNYPNNLIARLVKNSIPDLSGVEVYGECEQGNDVPGYGRPDLLDREALHFVEVGTTSSEKLLWCIENRRSFWWAGVSTSYYVWRRAWKEKEGTPPKRSRVVLVKISLAKIGRGSLAARSGRIICCHDDWCPNCRSGK